MSSNNIENDYEVELKVDKEQFIYDSVKKLPILLKGHPELPQDYKFACPKLSKEGKYLTAIGKANNEKDNDIIYIWDTKRLNRNKISEIKGLSKIFAVEFGPDENTLAIIYENVTPVFIDFKKGEEISRGQDKNISHTKIYSYSFSNKGKNFAIATDKDFVAYSIRTGKIKIKIISDSPIKIFRGDRVIFIEKDFNVTVMNFKSKEQDIQKEENKQEKKDKPKQIKNNITKFEFKLTSMGDLDNILCTMISPDKNFVYYMKSDGVYKISIEDKEITQQRIESISDGLISEDCKICMTTDKKTKVKFWDLERFQSIGDLYKGKFNSFSVNFEQSKLITCDDICIDLTDIMNDKAVQKFIWLDLNPQKFESFSFSPDYKVLLAKIDEHSAISYNCITGEVIRKWKVNLPNWSRACEMVPETSNIGVIATKSENKIIKIWDYLTGTDFSTFKEFDVNNFAFSKYGNYLAAGTVEGEEIARVWDLTNGDEFSYYFRECQNNNKSTFVNISKSEPLKIIAVAEEQNPVIFDLKEKQLILECIGCPIQLSSISNVQSNEGNKCFFIYGKDMNSIDTAILYDFKGQMINEYNNCRNIQFGKEDKYLLTDSDNINKGLLTISNIEDPNNITETECGDPGVTSKFLGDNKYIVTSLDIEENNKSILIIDIETGNTVGEILFVKKTEKYTEIFITPNKTENNIFFRFIELINPKNK